MKIRSGFVSNSSSSSFVVKPDITTSDLALIMMSIVEDRYKHYGWEVPEEFNKALKWLHENPDYNNPIMFPWSTNEETFIWHIDSGVQVATCNNYSWYKHIEYDYTGEEPEDYDWRDMEFLNLENPATMTTKNRYWKEKYSV